MTYAFFIGICFGIKGNVDSYNFIFACLALVLAGGDSFHLVPRIIYAFKAKFKKYDFWAGFGLMVSSITMTIFYVILDGIYSRILDYQSANNMLCILASIRIIICLFPQNNWLHKAGNMKWSIIRNVPFIFIGIISVINSFKAGYVGVGIAIIISFACYLPVVWGAKKNPKLGMLMIPKTIAYMYILGYFYMLGN